MNRYDIIAGSIAVACIMALFGIYKYLSTHTVYLKTFVVPESKCFDVYIPEKCKITSANAYSGHLSVTCFFEETNTYSTFVQPAPFVKPTANIGAAWFSYHPTKDFGSMIIREMTN